jgi:hypothetical protein
MDRSSFEFLYLHAHAIADLSFLRGMAAALASPVPDLSPEQFAANAAAAEQAMNVTEVEFDWSAFDGVPGFDATAGTGLDTGDAVTADVGPTFGEALEQAGATLDGDGPPELAPYLVHLHAARELLQPRIGMCHDMAGPELDAVLLDLPPDLAPLNRALSAAEFLPWLEAYEQQHDGVSTVVAMVRELDSV